MRTVSFAPETKTPPLVNATTNLAPLERYIGPIHTYARSEVSEHLFIYQGEDGKPRRPVTFTQYLRPDGRRQAVTILMPHDVADKADQLRAIRLVLECEVLRTGEVSLTITDQEEEHDVDIRVVPNGPGVPEAVMDLVRKFNLEEFKR